MNLLVDPLFRIATEEGYRDVSLPDLLEALGDSAVQHLVRIQRHQVDAFHVFLSYLAGAVLAHRGERDPRQSSEYWHSGLLNLAGEIGTRAWNLIEEDLSLPAFMQPPLPQEDHGGLKDLANTPDSIDLLVTAKNHDLKRSRMVHATPDEWIYALVSLQTMSGYYAPGYPGISRMNSGFGNRPIVELIRSIDLGERFRDAITRLFCHRDRVLRAGYGFCDKGTVLVWVETWDGKSSLSLSHLDPFYIEICRRVRLKRNSRKMSCQYIPSSAWRINARDLKGIIGDAWLPIDLGDDNGGSNSEERALTVTSRGLDPRILHRLVFAERLQMTALHRPMQSWDGDCWFHVSVLVRGQGRTDGFHERRIHVPQDASRIVFGSPTPQLSFLAAASKSCIEYAAKMQNQVLKPAIRTIVSNNEQSGPSDKGSAEAWWTKNARRFEARWAREHFPWLWSLPEEFDISEVLDGDWAPRLTKHAHEILLLAIKEMPKRSGSRYKGHIMAERVFWQRLYRRDLFGFLRGEQNGDSPSKTQQSS